ncbi:MAG: LytTR family transcriptional regulator DNA-binding domain-containing protein [Solobacterium sp.]|nr:LytTR family transcriptional regulator DNA-binding domain-containing protein [Solobacterium sp.]
MKKKLLRVCVIDDERKYADLIAKAVRKILTEQSVPLEVSGFTSFADVDGTYDIYLLDIRMPGLSGFEISEKLRASAKAVIAFVTADLSLVYQAFSYSPYGFVRKDCLEEDLKNLFSRYLKECRKQIRFRFQYEQVCLPVDQVILIEVRMNQMTLYTQRKTYTFRSSMKRFVEDNQLGQQAGYYQLNQSQIVNLNHVQEILKGSVKMDNGMQVYPSGKYKDAYYQLQEAYYDT